MSEDPLEDGPNVSSVSSPDLELDVASQEPPLPVKRKGGRKPVYATLEERKQRNRQAQAAFRERRTEYIKQLEVAMKENEEAMEQLQQNNREVVEECHMLRYKTSLLEDLLYENGIDYQSELQSRSSKSLLGGPFPAQGSSRGQWSQQPGSDAQRAKGQRPLQSPQKLKPKSKAPNAQTISASRAQPGYMIPTGPAHRMNAMPMQHDPISTGQATFAHQNGAIHSMQSSMHRQGPQFQDSQVDPSMSNNDDAGPYYAVDANHMANYLGPERFSDTNAYNEPRRHSNRQDALPRPNSSQYRQAQQFALPSQDLSPSLGNQRPRPVSNNSNHELYRQNSFNQSPHMGPEAMELSRGNDLSQELFENDALS